jgi:hypothetical protein
VKRVLLVLIAVLCACGKRGDPHPPVPLIPQATTDLLVTQRGTKLILSWSYPSLTTSGQKLGSLRRVVLYRYVENLPAAQPARDPKTLLPGDIDPTIPTAVALFAKIPPIGPMQFGKLRERADSIEGSALAAATVGAKLLYEDNIALQTSDGRPVRVNYAVVTEGQEARSASSNLASIVPVNVAEPPANVSVTPKAEGVVLTWTAPDKGILGGDAKPFITGYDIFRYPASDEIEELAKPVNPTPVKQTTFTDVPAYGEYNYRVEAVSAIGPPRLTSEYSEPAKATYKDLSPPPTPANLNVLIETKTLRLVWDAVNAPDLAGYRVYRTEVAGKDRKVVGRLLFTKQPIKETNWSDVPDPGLEYLYEVTAVDKSGNESAPAKTDYVLVPKTP